MLSLCGSGWGGIRLLLGSLPIPQEPGASAACVPTPVPRVAGGGRSVAGERSPPPRSGACMAPGALVCVCSWRGQRSAAPPRVAALHVSPRLSIFRSAAIRRSAARLGTARPGRRGGGGADPPLPGGGGGGRDGGPPARPFLRSEAPGRFGGVFALARYRGSVCRRGGRSSVRPQGPPQTPGPARGFLALNAPPPPAAPRFRWH